MTAIKTFIKKYPVLTYCVLTLTISWSSLLIAVGLGPGGFSATPEQFQALIPYVIPAMLLGPGVVTILVTGLVDGRAGLRAFRSRLLRWRVGARWYAVALLTAPLSMLAVFFALSLISPAFLPRIVTANDKTSVLLMGLAAGLGAGIFEELGLTGFAVPRVRPRYGVLQTGLIVGVLWSTWHFLVGYWSSGVTSGQLSLAFWLSTSLVGMLVGELTAYRVLMVWIYDRTESLLVAMLMHVSLTASTVILFDPAAVEVNWISGFAHAAALWVVVAVVQGLQTLPRHGRGVPPFGISNQKGASS